MAIPAYARKYLIESAMPKGKTLMAKALEHSGNATQVRHDAPPSPCDSLDVYRP